MKKFFALSIGMFVLAFAACSKDNTDDPSKWFQQPQIGSVSGTMATVVCHTSFGEGVLTASNAGFAYAPLEGEGAGVYQLAADVSVSGSVVTCRLSGLNPQTLYMGYAFAQIGSEQMTSTPIAFQTGPLDDSDRTAPTFGTPDASGVTASTATLNCSFAYTGDSRIEEAYFQHTAAGGDPQRAAVSAEAGSKSASLTGLTASTAYTFTLCVEIDGKTYSSAAGTFTTPAEGEVVPTFGTPTSSAVTSASASVSGSFAYKGSKTITKVYFRYGNSSQAEVTDKTPGVKSASLTGLTASTAYTFTLCVEIDGKTYSSAQATFTTLASSGGGSGQTKHAGWAELPAEQQKAGDYYYAYHMRDDAKSLRNYSICYSADMRCAVWVAYPLHTCYDGSAGRNDSWKKDPIVPSSVQPNLTGGSYVSGYSRGHMIASSDRQISVSTNKQTFYVTNMAPQLQDRFNGGIWNVLEKGCWNNICSDTLFMVTGAHFANTNTTVKDQSGNRVVVPTHFYKVLIRSKSGNTRKPLWELSADQIQCVGFWFEHRNYSGETPSQHMTSVAEIERQIGFTLFPNVPQAPKSTFSKSDWSFK